MHLLLGSLRRSISTCKNQTLQCCAPVSRLLQDWCKTRLASYSYPREITFLDALPMTVTGKVIRKDLKALATSEQTP